MVSHEEALRTACPTCQVAPGERCVSRKGKQTTVHAARYVAANEARYPLRNLPQVQPGERRKLPDERIGTTHKFRIGSEKGYLTCNVYDDGTPGEIFLRMDRQGSTVSGFCDAWSIAVSIMLQLGVPLDYIVGKYRGARFPPEGMTDNNDIRIATSPVDYVVRWLELRFGGAPMH